MAVERSLLSGSERKPQDGARVVGTANPTDIIEVTVVVRRRNPLEISGEVTRVSREEFAERYGANPADLPPIEGFAREHDLTIVDVNLARRAVVVSGTVANMNEAFGTQLKLYQGPEGVYRGRTGGLYIPVALQEIVIGVFGLDERTQAHSRCRRDRNIVGPRAAGDTSYSPIEVAKLYSFPQNATGAGQTVAIIELGGGYAISDLQAYFSALGVNVPDVTAASVDGGLNTPAGDPNSADGEVLLDIEVIGAIAPSAKIAVYFAPNTDQGFLDAITTAVHDTLRKPSIVSISWGGPESSWTPQSLHAYDQAFQDAALLDVTVCCASGDDGSRDGVTDGGAHVDFPASSPHVVACGGTRLESSAGAIRSEVVWNQGLGNGASGGGVSEVFARPVYQQAANVPVSVNPSHFQGRGVPDVSGDADPATGYRIRVDGKDAVFGGTSAVAPLWAALIALLGQRLGRSLGYLNPVLYTSPVDPVAFRDITAGTNGAYSATPGWDACTGLGSPNGAALLTALSGRVRTH
jgi:kumamolisin